MATNLVSGVVTSNTEDATSPPKLLGRMKTTSASPGRIAGGTFDDTGWLKIDRHVWTRSAHHWMAYPPGVERFEKSSR